MTYDAMEHFNEIRQCLDAFLAENVKVYPEPKQVEVFNLTFDSSTLSGEFECLLDDTQIDYPLAYCFDVGSQPTLIFPMFYSPCGFPGSFSEIELTYQTKTAMKTAIRELIERNFGVYRDDAHWPVYQMAVNEDLSDYRLYYNREELEGTDNFDFELGNKTFEDYSKTNAQVHV